MPEQAHKSAMKEVKRLKKMPSHMPEHAMIRSAFFFLFFLWFAVFLFSAKSCDKICIHYCITQGTDCGKM